MLRSFFFVALCAAPFAFAPAPTAAPAPLAPLGCPNLWTHEPLVVYDVTGSTLAGPVDQSLVVYADGTAKLSSASAVPGQGKAVHLYLTPQQALALARELFFAGSFTTCDQPQAGADIPLQTLTVFRGATQARAHTFSWWIAENEYATFGKILGDFIAAHFPGF